ncbi:hypothetical protein T439DRAFT_354967 [Meredithblackwellia eburnea MCA 4105]
MLTTTHASWTIDGEKPGDLYTNMAVHAWVGELISSITDTNLARVLLPQTWTPSVASGMYQITNDHAHMKSVWLELVCAGDRVSTSHNLLVQNPDSLKKCSWEGPMPAAVDGKGCGGLTDKMNDNYDAFVLESDTTETNTYTPSISDADPERKVWLELFCGDTAYANPGGSMLNVTNPKGLTKCP